MDKKKKQFLDIAESLYDSGYGFDLNELESGLTELSLPSKVRLATILKMCSATIDIQLASCDHNNTTLVRDNKKVCSDCGRFSFKEDSGDMYAPVKWGKWMFFF